MDKYLLLIDGSSLLSTQFFGNLPSEVMFAKTVEEKEKYYYKIMQTSKGVYTNAVFGFVRSLMAILKNQKPAYLAVAWDLSRDTFRRELYPECSYIEPVAIHLSHLRGVLSKKSASSGAQATEWLP